MSNQPHPAETPVIAVIGGSGVYDIDGLEDRRWITVESPFGTPSDDIMEGVLDGQRVLFLAAPRPRPQNQPNSPELPRQY